MCRDIVHSLNMNINDVTKPFEESSPAIAWKGIYQISFAEKRKRCTLVIYYTVIITFRFQI